MATNIKNILASDEEFTEKYFKLLVNRVTHSNLELEPDLGNVDDSKNALALNDNMETFEKLLELLPVNIDLTPGLIISLANRVNKHEMYISDGFRNVGKYLADTDIEISKPQNIRNDITELLDNYYNNWNDLTPYQREAQFHIKFIKIHPFEDGNGRTSRLIMNYNLLRQGESPVIITDDLLEYYYSYIKNDDVDNMTRLLELQATKEHDIVNEFYSEFKEEKHIAKK